MAKKIDPLNKKQYGAVSAVLTVSDITAAVNFLSKGLRLYQARHNELPRWQAHPRRVDAARDDFDAGAGKPRTGQEERQNRWRFTDGSISLRRRCRQSGRQRGRSWSNSPRSSDGHVLG